MRALCARRGGVALRGRDAMALVATENWPLTLQLRNFECQLRLQSSSQVAAFAVGPQRGTCVPTRPLPHQGPQSGRNEYVHQDHGGCFL